MLYALVRRQHSQIGQEVILIDFLPKTILPQLWKNDKIWRMACISCSSANLARAFCSAAGAYSTDTGTVSIAFIK